MVTLAVALGCVCLSRASHTPTPTPTSTHTPLVDNSEEEVDEPCFEPCTCEVKEGVLHVHCDGRGFTNVSQVSVIRVEPQCSSSYPCGLLVSLTHHSGVTVMDPPFQAQSPEELSETSL